MEELARELARILSTGDLAGAEALVESLREVDAARYESGRAGIALYQRDPEALLAHATRAHELSPEQPLPEQYLGIAHLLRLRLPEAERHCRRAVELSGGGKNARLALGSVLLAADRPAEAQAVYRDILAADSTAADALFCLGTASAKRGDYGVAVESYARAWALDPANQSPLANLLELYADLGRLLGASAAIELARPTSQNSEVSVALDMVDLNLTRLIAGRFPERNTVAHADRAVERVVSSATGQAPRVVLAAARALADIQRIDETAALLGPLRALPLDASDRGNLLFLDGYLARARGDLRSARAAWVAAVEADPRRVDAATNAVSSLLESGEADAMARIEALLGAIPDEIRAATSPLLFNEAVYRVRIGQRDRGLALLARVEAMCGAAANPEPQLLELARKLRTELSDN